jgi:RNA polymerase sigma-70 factor (ECF subfamily)
MWRTKRDELDPWPDDRALVKRMRSGDEAAFEQFFEAYFHALYRFALARVGQDSELAKEIAQNSICKAIEKLDTYRGEAALYSWLCSVCRFEISGHFRRARRMPPTVDLVEDLGSARGVLDSLPSGLDDPECALLRSEIARLVHVTVDHLPPHYSQILEWKYSDGLSVIQIAWQLGVSAKAAESLLARARQAFRDGFAGLASPMNRDALKAGK